MTMERPVIVQITIVSMNVPVMDTRPWRTGSFVWAAAAAIGALPRPDSLEKIPRAIPFCIATTMVPIAPPASALPVKADFTIVTIAAGTAVMFVITMISAINGTTTWDTFAILWIPPRTTSPTHTVSIRHATTVAQEYVFPKSATVCALSGSKKLVTADEIPFTCVKVPIPKSPTPAPKNAKIFASHLHCFPIPFSM